MNSFADRIVCLTQNKCTDFANMAASIGMEFEWSVAHQDLNHHLQVCVDAFESGVQRLMVFSDDARLVTEQFDLTRLDRFHKQLDTLPWDVVYLGYMPSPFSKIATVNDGPLATCTHPTRSCAYILTRKLLQAIYDQRNTPIKGSWDSYLQRLANTHYVYYPMVFVADKHEWGTKVVENLNAHHTQVCVLTATVFILVMLTMLFLII